MFRRVETLDQCLGRLHPADAEAGRQHLRHRAQIQHAAAAIVGADRPGLRLGRDIIEVQQPVGIVLDNQNVATLGPLEHPRALAQTQQRSGRILKVGHEVQQLDGLARAPSPAATPRRDARG